MPVIVCTLLQPENVLIKSDNSKSIGFQTKLSDFGLAKLLRENYYIVNRSGSGTVTHLAPELFQVSARLRHAHTFSLLQMSWQQTISGICMLLSTRMLSMLYQTYGYYDYGKLTKTS